MKTIENLLEQAKSDENHSSISKAEKNFTNQTEALQEFNGNKEKLLNIECWNESGNLSSYELFNQKGEVITSRKIAENLLLRISLKGTGKYDWVKVIEIVNNEREMILTVQPTFDPNEENPKSVSHFFTAEARNNFCLQSEDTKISFYIIGLNEKYNVILTSDFVVAVRNWVAANVGSYLGIQKSEWKTFAENFLQI